MHTNLARHAWRLCATMRGLVLVPPRRKDGFLKNSAIRFAVLAAGLVLAIALAASPAIGAEGIDTETDKILRSMTTYLGGLSTFSAHADVDMEILDLSGQKLQLSSSAKVIVKRPENLYVRRTGALADLELVFDGKRLTLHGKDHNVYSQIERPGTIDDAIDTLRSEFGFDAPGADLFYADPYPILATGVLSSAYLGTAYVNGVECHHLTFREPKTDWQLWVQAGDAPLPMKYVITTKWLTGAPQFSVRFREWDTKPEIKSGQFKFSAPPEAKRLDSIQADEMGELIIEEVK